MNQLTLELPEALYQELENLAQESGISLSRYILHALEQAVAWEKLAKRGVPLSQFEHVPLAKVIQQHQEFLQRKNQCGRKPTDEEMEAFLASREQVEPEPELDPKAVAALEEQLIREWKRRRAGAESPVVEEAEAVRI